MADNHPMSDLSIIAQSVARIDERTQNMVSTMQRVETGLVEHKATTDKRFDDIMEKHINPLKEQITPIKEQIKTGKIWLGLLSLGGGAGGALTAEKIMHLLGLR